MKVKTDSGTITLNDYGIIEPAQLIFKKMGFKSLRELTEKYRVTIIQNCIFIEEFDETRIILKVYLTDKATNQKTRKMFIVRPQDMNLRKSVEILCASEEQTVKGSQIIKGYSIFKVRVTLSTVGEYKNKFLFVNDASGELMIVDVGTLQPFTQTFNTRILKAPNMGFCSWKRAKSKRKPISEARYKQLKVSGILCYIDSPKYGLAIEIVPRRKKQSFELIK